MNLALMVSAVALASALSGCATLVKGNDQTVAVTTSPVTGSQCTLTNSEGTYFVVSPGNVVVNKTKNDLTVLCKKDGFNDGTLTIAPKFGATTAANILAGGVIGIAIDAASGANYEYPQIIDIPMTPVGQSPAGQPRAALPNEPGV